MKCVIFAVFLGACATPEPEPAAPEPEVERTPQQLPLTAPGGLAAAVGQPVSIEARDLVILQDGAKIRVPYLSGRLTPAAGGDLVDLEVPTSFEVKVDALEVRISEQTLQGVMSSGENPPFRELVVRTEGESLVIEGTAPLGLPFSFRANPRITKGGALALELEKVRVLGIGIKGFIGAFQGKIERAANKKGHIINVDEERLVIDPFPFIGPPKIKAEFTSVELREREIVARLGELTAREEGEGEAGLVLSGGAIRTGQTILLDPVLSLRAKDGGSLVIDPTQFGEQIEQGFTKQHAQYTTLYLVAPEDLSSSGQSAEKDAGTPPGTVPTASGTTPARDR